MTKTEAVDKLCNTALAEVGYREGYDNYNKYAANPLVTEALGWDAQNQPWCFTEDTLILTDQGYKPIQDINVGDYVLNAHGDRFNQIISIAVHDAVVCDYRVYGALKFSATLDHPFLSEKRIDKQRRSTGFEEWGFNKISDLRKGDMIAAPKSPVLYENNLSYDDLWTIGYYVGDGYCSRRSEYVLCANEKKAEKINIHAKGHWDKDYPSRTCKQFNLSVSGNSLLKEILDDCGHGALHKRVPKQILFGTDEAKRAFIDGYFSADGCESTQHFISISSELVTGIARILMDIGKCCSVNSYSRPPQSKIWDQRINAYRTINQHEVYYDCGISKTENAQHQDYLQKGNYMMLPLREIGKTRTDIVYTLSTDGDNTYTANNLAVHNCSIFVVAMFIDAFGFYAGCHLMYGCSALCRTQADYYRENASFYSKPQKGDQVFFYYGGDINHTGIVVDVSESNITTVEGNSGDRVAQRTYRISDSSIAGYGRPNWSIVADDKPDDPVEEERHYPTLQYLDGIGNPLSIVKAWQHLLLCWGYDIGKWGADGEYGVMTMQRTKDLQKRVGIEADGIVGEETWKQGIKIPVGGVK